MVCCFDAMSLIIGSAEDYGILDGITTCNWGGDNKYYSIQKVKEDLYLRNSTVNWKLYFVSGLSFVRSQWLDRNQSCVSI
jgi:hypothetical protein